MRTRKNRTGRSLLLRPPEHCQQRDGRKQRGSDQAALSQPHQMCLQEHQQQTAQSAANEESHQNVCHPETQRAATLPLGAIHFVRGRRKDAPRHSPKVQECNKALSGAVCKALPRSGSALRVRVLQQQQHQWARLRSVSANQERHCPIGRDLGQMCAQCKLRQTRVQHQLWLQRRAVRMPGNEHGYKAPPV